MHDFPNIQGPLDPPFQSAIEACAVVLKRTVEKLEAQTALSRLRATLPGLLSES